MSGAPGDHEVRYGFGWSSIRLFRSHSATRAKCDMLATVAFDRLDLLRTERDSETLLKRSLGRELINSLGRTTRESPLYREGRQVVASQRNDAMCH